MKQGLSACNFLSQSFNVFTHFLFTKSAAAAAAAAAAVSCVIFMLKWSRTSAI
jgi:hypothetical protein